MSRNLAVRRLLAEPPPTPELHRLLPSGYWARRHWPCQATWPTGRDFTLFVEGAGFVPGESVILFGQRAIPSECPSRAFIQAWIVAPDDPVTVQVRVRTGLVISNPLPFTFYEIAP